MGSIPGGGEGNPFQYSRLENFMDREAWQATVHGVTGLDTTEHTCIYTYIRLSKDLQSRPYGISALRNKTSENLKGVVSQCHKESKVDKASWGHDFQYVNLSTFTENPQFYRCLYCETTARLDYNREYKMKRAFRSQNF